MFIMSQMILMFAIELKSSLFPNFWTIYSGFDLRLTSMFTIMRLLIYFIDHLINWSFWFVLSSSFTSQFQFLQLRCLKVNPPLDASHSHTSKIIISAHLFYVLNLFHFQSAVWLSDAVQLYSFLKRHSSISLFFTTFCIDGNDRDLIGN